jgi:hypothetical protein
MTGVTNKNFPGQSAQSSESNAGHLEYKGTLITQHNSSVNLLMWRSGNPVLWKPNDLKLFNSKFMMKNNVSVPEY